MENKKIFKLSKLLIWFIGVIIIFNSLHLFFSQTTRNTVILSSFFTLLFGLAWLFTEIILFKSLKMDLDNIELLKRSVNLLDRQWVIIEKLRKQKRRKKWKKQ